MKRLVRKPAFFATEKNIKHYCGVAAAFLVFLDFLVLLLFLDFLVFLGVACWAPIAGCSSGMACCASAGPTVTQVKHTANNNDANFFNACYLLGGNKK